MSSNDCMSSKTHILKVLENLSDQELNDIESWISSKSYKIDLQNMKIKNELDSNLLNIGNFLKTIVPLEVEFASEKIIAPEIGDQADCNQTNTLHIDEFLYDDTDVEQLVKEGLFKRHFCTDCKSRNIQDLIYISHSMSRNGLQYIFKVLLPEDLHGKQILDIGSRIGSVLYGAYYLSNASKIVGIEINEECCDVQNKVIEHFSLDNNRIKVIHSDVLECPEVLLASNVVFINVLDFFVDIDKHKKMWHFFKNNLQKGSYLLTNRCLSETLQMLDLLEDFFEWFIVCKPFQLHNEILFDLSEYDYHEVFIYCIN